MTFACQVYDPTSGDGFLDNTDFPTKEEAEARRAFLSSSLLGAQVTIIQNTKTVQNLNPFRNNQTAR